MVTAELLVLESRIRLELQQLERLSEELQKTLKPYKNRPVKNTIILRALGSILHDFYSGCEKIFLHIAREIDRTAPKSESWHRLLLEQMTLPLKGIRPPVITSELAGELAPFLSFRHRFRHRYGFDLEWERMESLVKAMPDTVEHFQRTINSFLDMLAEADNREQNGGDHHGLQ
jgi:uncharacterized protein YutE (UPF0331/DUF86 family)